MGTTTISRGRANRPVVMGAKHRHTHMQALLCRFDTQPIPSSPALLAASDIRVCE